jgi:hypothetical protein
MADVLSEIDRQKKAEAAAAFNKNETAMAKRLALPQPEPITEQEWARLRPWVKFCELNGVRHCPARPTTIAAFIAEREYRFEPVETLQAIARFHDFYGLANPVTTNAVRAVLEPLINVGAPRSWPKADREMFLHLPPEAREIIARREQDREQWLRRTQNELAEQRKKLDAQTKTEAATDGPANGFGVSDIITAG